MTRDVLERKGKDRNIEHIPNIRGILSGISYDSVIVWDLDNTILQSRHELGSDQWYGALLGIAQAQLGPKFCLEVLNTTYNQVQSLVDVQKIEHDTIKLIDYFNRIGISQWLVTARNTGLYETTQRQLEKCNIRFIAERMLFCNGQNKGHCLEMTFARCHYRPAHIVVIDDKQYNVQSLREAAIRMNIRFNGFVYQFLNDKVQSFDVRHAHFQLALVTHLLTGTAQNFLKSLELGWEKHHEEAYSQLRFNDFIIEFDAANESKKISYGHKSI